MVCAVRSSVLFMSDVSFCNVSHQQAKAEEEAATDPALVAELQREVEDLRLRLHMAAEHYKEKYKECQRLQKQVLKLSEQQGVGPTRYQSAYCNHVATSERREGPALGFCNTALCLPFTHNVTLCIISQWW